MAITFKVHFRRYCSRSGETRISGPQWLRASGFAHACDKADLILSGMVAADPDRDYAIVTVEMADAYRGIECDGARMFETTEELAARIAGESK